jgi:parallel beta-helix repeat protein
VTKGISGGIAFVAAFAVAMSTAGANTIQVETTKDQFGAGGSPKCALREAVQAANQNQKFGGCSKGQGADRIVLGPSAYKLSVEVDDDYEDENVEGDLDVTGNLTIAGKGAKRTAIDGNSEKLDERVMQLHAGNLTVSDLTVRDGQEYDEGGDGGGIHNAGSGKLTVRNSRVVNSQTYDSGGALAVTGEFGDLVVISSTLAENTAGDYGGAISGYSDGSAITVRNSRIVGNFAYNGPAIITGEGPFKLLRSVVANNSGTDYGGGIDLYHPTSTVIRQSTISGNRATANGGAIFDENSDGPVLIESTTIADNRAGSGGGGIYAADSESWTIRNSTFSRNEAMNDAQTGGYGGAIYNAGASITLESVTITRNAAYDVAGIYSSAGSLTLRNSIVARNQDYDEDQYYVEDCDVAGGTITSAGHNLFGDGSCGTAGTDIAGDANVQVIPDLEPLANNGGPTQTHALMKGSPAINKGQGCPTRDQRGKKRVGKCDIGAFER